MGTRLQSLTVGEVLITEACITCGVVFAMPDGLQARLLETRRSFYCPNGHSMSYTGKTEAEKQKEARQRAEAEATRLRQRLDQAQAQIEHEAARARGYKGAMVKAKARSAKGVCPAPGCKRSFVDVAKHVATKHPNLLDHQAEPESILG